MELILKGRQGKSVVVTNDAVRIEKHGLFGHREKTFPIRNISSVEVKQPGAMFAGFIQFSIAGGAALHSSFKMTGGAFDAAKDENSVVFVGDDNYQIARRIKAHIEEWARTPVQADPRYTTDSRAVADELRKLKALVDEGVLTIDEFASQKRRLLGE